MGRVPPSSDKRARLVGGEDEKSTEEVGSNAGNREGLSSAGLFKLGTGGSSASALRELDSMSGAGE